MSNTRCSLLGFAAAIAVWGCDTGDGLENTTDSTTNDNSDGGTESNDDTGPGGTGIDYKPMTDCEGGAYDPNSNLCWESDPVSLGDYTWDEATNRCESLEAGGHTDWRLPTISELRSFYRPGDKTACLGLDWSMDWNEPPPGYCGVYDGCVSSDCYSKELCSIAVFGDCLQADGPGQHDNCYWDSYITGSVICQDYWSSSTNDKQKAWKVNFRRPTVSDASITSTGYVRCVRTGK